MKKLIIISILFFGIISFTNTTNAQNINVSINIGSQPSWGPVGYDYVGYYYFPDINCYYDVNQGVFIYLNSGRWISARYLPYNYRNYDLYVMHKIVLNDPRPWRYNHRHYTNYSRYKGHRGQVVIRDSRDKRYNNSRKNNVVWYSPNNNRPSNNYRPNNTRPNNSRPNNTRPNSNNRPTNNNRPNINNNQNNRPSKDNNSQTTRPNRDRTNSNGASYVKTSGSRNNESNRSTRRTGRTSTRTDKNVTQNSRNSHTR